MAKALLIDVLMKSDLYDLQEKLEKEERRSKLDDN